VITSGHDFELVGSTESTTIELDDDNNAYVLNMFGYRSGRSGTWSMIYD
jgi:hypothetical protein